jgi:hypothetical protein
LAWDYGAEQIFEVEIFFILTQKSPAYKQVVPQWNKMAKSFPHYAYSFMSLMLHQYDWCCDSYSAHRRCPAKKKIRKIALLALGICTTVPISAWCNISLIILAEDYTFIGVTLLAYFSRTHL